MKINKEGIYYLSILLVLVFLLSPSLSFADSSYWKTYFKDIERVAVQKNAEKYTRLQVKTKAEKWKGLISSFHIKNGSIKSDDIKSIDADKIKGGTFSGLLSWSAGQTFIANNLTGVYAALDGSNITNLNPANISTGSLDLGSGTLTSEEAVIGSTRYISDISELNTAITALEAEGGGTIYIPAGTYEISVPIVLKTGVYIKGAGLGSTTIKAASSASGVDLPAIFMTEDFDTLKTGGSLLTNAPHDYGVEGITIDGNYLSGNWNSVSSTIVRSSGYGIKNLGYGFRFDVELINIPEVGMLSEGEGSQPANQDMHSSITLQGRVFGKEGFIMRGPGDIQIPRLWIGNVGILPFSTGVNTLQTSTEYSGERVDGAVIDATNIEAGAWHIYACWNGHGVKTRNTVRLEADHIISESNKAGIYLSTGTYGMISKLSIRNNGEYYPSWTGTTPTYNGGDTTGYDSDWDAATIESIGFQIGEYLNFRTDLESIHHIDGWKSLVLTANSIGNRIGFSHRNSTYSVTSAPYAGDAVHVLGYGNMVDASLHMVNGNGVTVAGTGNVVKFSDTTGEGGYALVRDGGATNNNRANTIIGSVKSTDNTRGGLNSTQGNPMSETITLSLDLGVGATAFTGTDYDPVRAQHWDISGVVGTTKYEKVFRGDISSSSLSSGIAKFTPLATAPASPAEGDVVYANGTGWNPGAGAGLYVYSGGAWVKLH